MNKLPYEVREAVIDVCGKAFNYKGPLRDLLTTAGVPPELVDRHQDESKFKMARSILGDLDLRGQKGWEVQRRLVTELCKLRRVPDKSVTDQERARESLRALRELVTDLPLPDGEDRAAVDRKREERERQATIVALRERKLSDLYRKFAAMAASPDDPQGHGYGLEDLLVDLFTLSEVPYHPGYKTASQQIDGHFEYKNFHYLTEARWRKVRPRDEDLGALKRKAETKLASTRGLFVSMVGFREEVVSDFPKGATSNLILMSGEDVALILEGRVSLPDALDYKIDQASRLGVIYAPLIQLLNAWKAG